MAKNTLVINYRNMGVGGIENYIIGVMQLALDNGNRVIWLCDTKPVIAPIYAEVLNSEKVEKCPCDVHKHHWFRHEELCFAKDEKVVILSFAAFDHVRALELKQEYKEINITALYLIPHFTGSLIYPEQYFKKGKDAVQKRFSRLYAEWINAGSILFFNNKHITAMEETYGIKVDEQFRKLVPLVFDGFTFDETEVLNRYRRDEFRIVSAGRLEFPHKGFVLGMLKEFAALKETYPQVTYYIVGDGLDEQTVREEISKLPEKVSKDIHLLAPMPFEQLIAFFKECNLNISVAGCASYGAKSGLVTLPARHYTYDCEVYGFLPESRDCTIQTKPGEPVRPYIEQVLNMSEQEYLERARMSFDAYNQNKVNKNAFFEISGANNDYVMKKSDVQWVKACFACTKLLYILQAIKKRFG